ncbi:uncharacterized protein LOC144619743 isoform X2 [Crassostrea virginica]
MRRLCITYVLYVLAKSEFCKSPEGLVCCHGYRKNPQGDGCIPCDIGFVGLNCATQCSYPSFGRECQSECKCNKTLCNHAYGCLSTTDINKAVEVFTTENTRDLITLPDGSKTTLRNDETSEGNGTQNPMSFVGVYISVICLTVILCVFLVLYFGLRFFMIRYRHRHS